MTTKITVDVQEPELRVRVSVTPAAGGEVVSYVTGGEPGEYGLSPGALVVIGPEDPAPVVEPVPEPAPEAKAKHQAEPDPEPKKHHKGDRE